MKIAFDVDDTLWAYRSRYNDQVPDYDLIQVLRWFAQNGDDVIVWSGAGVQYAQQIVTKLGLDGLVRVIGKGDEEVDIAFDDMDASLGRVDIKVNRPLEHRYEGLTVPKPLH